MDVDNADAVLAHGHARVVFVGDRAEIYTAAQRHAGYMRTSDDPGMTAEPASMMRHASAAVSMKDLREQILIHQLRFSVAITGGLFGSFINCLACDLVGQL